MLGPVSSVLYLEDIATGSARGATSLGEDDGFGAGAAVAGGDVDGDGWGDLLVSSPDADSGSHTASGAVYLHHASHLGLGGPYDLSTADARFSGADDNEGIGTLACGDLDGDGHWEVIVGGPNHTGLNIEAGAVYIVWGQGI